ncbi:hypothetical protein SLEP1_g50750 [Rubroshorea leprosula]|uniref:Uncharacterized protein n=1 Tax=Rubroshorea leprosula TaxID=152421 RepID=A0AAV5M124_9ROSI|nr:hypothetical protein SLEP1_g50750 [Rubroshorea leprosula]
MVSSKPTLVNLVKKKKSEGIKCALHQKPSNYNQLIKLRENKG